MPHRHGGISAKLASRLRALLTGPHILALLPTVALGAFWLGDENTLVLVALGLSAVFALAAGFAPFRHNPHSTTDRATGLALRESLNDALDANLKTARRDNGVTACFLLELDDFNLVTERYGQAGSDEILHRIGERLRHALRTRDLVCKFGDHRFGVAISPVPHLDVETAIQMAARLQAAVEEPVSLDAITIYVSCSIGFCLSTRSPDRTSHGLIEAAAKALQEAGRHAPSAIRMYTDDMRRKHNSIQAFRGDIERALENGQIIPWFQPQISTDTGKVTGFEALARWCHPEQGMIAPAEFLPELEQIAKLERLGEVILYHSLNALKSWDSAGFDVQHVGVNFTGNELRNPKLLDKLKWELDRFDLEPERLSIEVLETVVATTPDDIITRNVNGLAKLGCRIELDDFGTGHASISSIRRFAVGRIKIDRSFVMKVDRDAEQQRMISAILTMAERLGLDTLAEGVETVGEHAMLAQLGCQHVQGFGIGRPMPFEQTAAWLRAHSNKLLATPRISRAKG